MNLEDYQTDLLQRVKPSTAAMYLFVLRRTAKWLAANSRSDLGAATICDLSDYVQAESRRGLASRSLKFHCAILRDWLRFRGEVNWKELAGPRCPARTIPFCPSEKEMGAMMDVALQRSPHNHKADTGLRDRALIHVGYATGMRVGELVGLTWEDVRFRELSIRLKQRKRRGEHVIHISHAAVNDLVKYLQSLPQPQPRTGRVFPISIHRAWELIRNLGRRAGFREDAHPHTLRYAYATHTLCRLAREDNDAALAYVAEQLGHQSWDTTALYIVHANYHIHLGPEWCKRFPRQRQARGEPLNYFPETAPIQGPDLAAQGITFT